MRNLSRTFTADALPWILVENNMPSQCREMFQRLLQGRTWQEVWGVGRTNRPLALKQEIDQVLSVQFLFELLDLFERLRQNVLRLALLGYLHVRSTAHGRNWIRRSSHDTGGRPKKNATNSKELVAKRSQQQSRI